MKVKKYNLTTSVLFTVMWIIIMILRVVSYNESHSNKDLIMLVILIIGFLLSVVSLISAIKRKRAEAINVDENVNT